MDEQVQKIKNSTGIELPKYYNPAAMNPLRYAEQIQKRRLLWQKKDGDTSTSTSTSASTTTTVNEQKKTTMGRVWEQTTFAQDSDGKVASKFKRLMGIKETPTNSGKDCKDILKKQEEMFSSMEQQYEVARTATHTMRGVGLGFGSFQYPR